jgi:peptide/nickel transport system substrate-binding protein
MTGLLRRVSVLALAVLTAASIGACGSSDNGGGGGGGKKGGTAKIGTTGPDSYDPVMFQTTQAYQALQQIYTPLTTYKHEEGDAGQQLIPGLATGLADVSADGKTYKYTLRKGLKYSDGSAVKASDVENSIRRLIHLAGPYSSFFMGIVGADEFAKDKNAKDIKGITTNDATGEITITLKEADGKFPFAMSEPYSAPTPAAKSPEKILTKNPPPGAGPYKLKVIDPSRRFVETRNPYWSDIPGIPKGNFDKFEGIVLKSVPRMSQDVIDGQLDFMTEDPTGDLLPQVRAKYKDRFSEAPVPPNSYYFFMNVREKPFDKKEVREAVNYAVDSRALVRVFGGRLTPGCNFLSPGVIGYKAIDPCPWGDPNGPGDVAKAKALVKKSGYDGMAVTVWTNNKDPRPAIGQYLADVLGQIGFKTKVKTLDQQVYFGTVGLVRTKAQIGFTDWFQDFPHPADFFGPLLDGTTISETGVNFNQGLVDDPHVNKEIARLTKAKDAKAVADDWAALDKYVVDNAYIVPYGFEKSTNFMSARMNHADCSGVHQVYKTDWLAFCLK